MYEPLFDSRRLQLPPMPPDFKARLDELVHRGRVLEPPSYAEEWPEVEPGSGEANEATGFPPIPAGFGYWPLMRVAAASGGKYLLTSFGPSKCPFRVAYDPVRLREIEPSVLSSDGRGLSENEEANLQLIWREISKAGLALHSPTFGSDGGFTDESTRRSASRWRVAYRTLTECRQDAEHCERARDDTARIEKLVAALQDSGTEQGAAGSPRLRATLDVIRVGLARARFHLGGQALVLRAARQEDLIQGERASAVLEARKRVTRFWGGTEAARREAEARLGEVPGVLVGDFQAALAVSCEVMDRWRGTPYGALAQSGALWVYRLAIIPPGTTEVPGEFTDPTGLPPGEVPGTPTSGGSGTPSGR